VVRRPARGEASRFVVVERAGKVCEQVWLNVGRDEVRAVLRREYEVDEKADERL
jgi:hypothetical protein